MAIVSGLIRVMEKAARKAGQRLRRDFGEVEHLQVSRKGPSDFVSKADQASERTIYDELRTARPDWGFLMEEVGKFPAPRASRAGWSIRSTAPATSSTGCRISQSRSPRRNPNPMVRGGAT